MKRLISLLCSVFMLTACTSGYKTIDSNIAMDLIENDAIVIDVRSSEEYDTGHIKDSINIPVEELNNINYDKDTVIIVYCASGMRSANAAKELIKNGYTNIYNLDGGLINWGFELEE